MTMARWWLAVAGSGPALITAGLFSLITAALTGIAPAPATSTGVAVPAGTLGCTASPPSPTGEATTGLSAEQLGNAAVIVDVADQRHLGDGAAVVGVMTALTESSLINIDHGDRLGPDSRGLFQQRNSWGPLAVRMDPGGAAGLFYDALVRVPGWQAMPPWVAAQTVQRSEFGDGTNYRDNYQTALTAVQALHGGTAGLACPATPTGTTDPAASVTAGAASSAGGESAGVSNGAWGGYSNGQIPASALCPLSAPGHLLRCDAAAAWNRMAASYRAETGNLLCITDSYRDLAAQQQLYVEKPGLAAVPGTSNHGWSLAADLCEPGVRSMGYATPTYRWLQANAGVFGWVHPSWADPGHGREEPWHWEYTGTPR